MDKAAETRSVDEKTLEHHLFDAHLPTLLAALAYAAGDLSILDPDFRPDPEPTPLGFPAQGGLSPQQQARARAAAAEAIRQLPPDAEERGPALPLEDVRTIMEYMMGDVGDDYFPLLLHELGLPSDVSAPTWHKHDLAPDRAFTVAIIGAGMSGIAAAYRLQQVGVPFVILERNPQLGGVWFENDYPGCRLDTSNFSYSYSFRQNGSWTEQYSRREAVLGYLKESADALGISDHVRLGTEVTAARYQDGDGSWMLSLRGPDGAVEQLHVQAVISAVGQLNAPSIPRLEGAESFTGPTWHTARWRHDVDVRGKRLGVVGTGASAFQAIQEIARVADHVTVFQRTAPWVIPSPGYNSALKPGLRWLLDHIPHYYRWYRVFSFWSSVDSRRPFAEVDPDWSHPLSVSEKNEQLRQTLLAHLGESLGDRPDLLEKMTPQYPPYAKRTLRDDGRWMQTLKRDNVTVVDVPIERMVETGIQTEDGRVHGFDAIVYGTGFRASDFLSTFSVTGAGGVDLHEHWDGEPRAYYGVTIPDFPNLFCLYGPNTNLNANGSVVLFSESGVDYIVDAIRVLLENGYRSLNVKRDVFDAYNERIDAANRRMVYGASSVNSWYKNASGRVTQNWPLKSVEYWKGTRRVIESEYDFTG